MVLPCWMMPIHLNINNKFSQSVVKISDQFREAAIQNGVVSKIRSDHILWIHENLSIAQQHTQTLLALAEQFNQAFYLGIREVEAHFASYQAGSFLCLAPR